MNSQRTISHHPIPSPPVHECSSVEEIDDEYLLAAEVKGSHEDRTSMCNLVINTLLLLAVILNSNKETQFTLFNSINTLLNFQDDQTKIYGEATEQTIEDIETMTEAWNKMKTVVNGLVFDPKGDLFAIKVAMDCAEKDDGELGFYQDAIYLSSFNQMIGTYVHVKLFSEDSDTPDQMAFQFYVEGNYDLNRYEFAREAEEAVSTPEKVSEIAVKAAIYNDFLGVLSMIQLTFDYEGVGFLTKHLEFRTIDPYFVLSGNGGFSSTKLFLFVMVIMAGLNAIVSYIVISLKLFRMVQVTIQTKTLEFDK